MRALRASTRDRAHAGRCWTGAARSPRLAACPRPSSVRTPSSITPASSHCRSSLSTRRSEMRRSTSFISLLVLDAPEVVADVGVEHVVAAASPELAQGLQRHRRAPLRPEAVRARKKIRLENRLQAPASPPSAPPGLGPSECPAAASSHRPSGCTGAAPRSAGTCLLAARRRALRGSARRRAARCRRASWHRRPPHRGSVFTRFHASARTSLLADAVVQRVETATRLPLGRSPQSTLELSHFVDAAARRRGGWVRSCRPCPCAYLLARRDHRRGPSLRSRCSSRPSSVLRPPRTPAARRSISPSAYTSHLAVTTAAQTGLPCSALLLARVLRPLPRRDPRRRVPVLALVGCCLRRDMSGSAPGLFLCRGCRLHFMLRPAFLLPP